MNRTDRNTISDSTPSVTLTVGELREVVRQEINAVLCQRADFRETENALSPAQQLSTRPYLDVREAAELTRLAVSTIRLYIRKGELKGQKLGRRIIISRGELERFLAGNSGKVTELFPSLTG